MTTGADRCTECGAILTDGACGNCAPTGRVLDKGERRRAAAEAEHEKARWDANLVNRKTRKRPHGFDSSTFLHVKDLSHQMDAAKFDDSPRELTEDECLARLHFHDVGRIAFDFEGRIEIFSVNYCMEGVIIVFRTSSGTKLEAVPKTEVAFEVDSWNPETGIGWSVVARGRAEEVTTNPGRVAEHLRWVPVHPVAPGNRWHWLAVKPSEITGRQFHVPPPLRERA